MMATIPQMLELPLQENTKAEILDVYKKGKEELCSYLDKLSCRFSLAIDLWTDNLKKNSYICFTLHFVDDGWKLKEKILAVKKLEYKCDAEALCKTVKGLVSDWKIEGRLCSVIVNNMADDVDDQLLKSYFKESDPLPCFPFFITGCISLRKRVVEEGLPYVNLTLENIRKCITYVLETPSRKAMFQAAVNQAKLQDSEEVLTMSDPYLTLQGGLRLREVFRALEKNDAKFTLNPSTTEWDKATERFEYVKGIYDALSSLAERKRLTASAYFTEVESIYDNYILCGREHDTLWQMTIDIENIFEKGWGDSMMALALAVAVDPRLKFPYLNDKLETFFGDSHAHIHFSAVFNCFSYLYIKYENAPSNLASLEDLSHDGSYLKYSFYGECAEEIYNHSEADLSPPIQFTQEEPCCSSEVNSLSWWRDNMQKYRVLAAMARDFLPIPLSTALSNSALGTEVARINQLFNDPDPEILEGLICGQYWMEMPEKK